MFYSILSNNKQGPQKYETYSTIVLTVMLTSIEIQGVLSTQFTSFLFLTEKSLILVSITIVYF